MEHFYEEGKKYELKDFRVLTSGILRSVLKPEDVVEDMKENLQLFYISVIYECEYMIEVRNKCNILYRQ